MIEALGRRGLEVVGLDRSPQMVEAAKRRLAQAGVAAEVVLADVTDFRLGRAFDGAICPINTLLHLTPTDLSRHLDRMAEHLRPGARYLAQIALDDGTEEPHTSRWEVTRDEMTLRIEWATQEIDLPTGRQRQRSRIEVVSGPRAGEIVEEEHHLTAWTPTTWGDAVSASPFAWTACYDGGAEGRPRVRPGATGRLLWHELTRS